MTDQLVTLIHHEALVLAASGLLYTATTTVAALIAVLAPKPAHRRDARRVLALLLRRTVNDQRDSGPRDSP